MSWLQYPVNLLRALTQRIEPLMATESLRRASEVALGSGKLERGAAEQLQAEWQRAIEGPRRPATVEDLRGIAATLGIPVVSG